MALFLLLLVLARSVLLILVLVQTGVVLTSGTDNEKLRDLGQSISKWVFQTLKFVTFNSEKKSFPFDDWPESEISEGYTIATPGPAFEEQKSHSDNDGAGFDENPEANEDVPSFTDSSVSHDLSLDDNSVDNDKK